jgi:hypothetical protein
MTDTQRINFADAKFEQYLPVGICQGGVWPNDGCCDALCVKELCLGEFIGFEQSISLLSQHLRFMIAIHAIHFIGLACFTRGHPPSLVCFKALRDRLSGRSALSKMPNFLEADISLQQNRDERGSVLIFIRIKISNKNKLYREYSLNRAAGPLLGCILEENFMTK